MRVGESLLQHNTTAHRRAVYMEYDARHIRLFDQETQPYMMCVFDRLIDVTV